MTAPTPKPEDAPPARRGVRMPGALLLGGGALIIFVVVTFALVQILPPPHSRADDIVIGTLSTLAALVTVFGGLVLARGKRRR